MITSIRVYANARSGYSRSWTLQFLPATTPHKFPIVARMYTTTGTSNGDSYASRSIGRPAMNIAIELATTAATGPACHHITMQINTSAVTYESNLRHPYSLFMKSDAAMTILPTEYTVGNSKLPPLQIIAAAATVSIVAHNIHEAKLCFV